MIEYCEGGDLAAIIKRCKREKWALDEFAPTLASIAQCSAMLSTLIIANEYRKKSYGPYSHSFCWRYMNVMLVNLVLHLQDLDLKDIRLYYIGTTAK